MTRPFSFWACRVSSEMEAGADRTPAVGAGAVPPPNEQPASMTAIAQTAALPDTRMCGSNRYSNLAIANMVVSEMTGRPRSRRPGTRGDAGSFRRLRLAGNFAVTFQL